MSLFSYKFASHLSHCIINDVVTYQRFVGLLDLDDLDIGLFGQFGEGRVRGHAEDGSRPVVSHQQPFKLVPVEKLAQFYRLWTAACPQNLASLQPLLSHYFVTSYKYLLVSRILNAVTPLLHPALAWYNVEKG